MYKICYFILCKVIINVYVYFQQQNNDLLKSSTEIFLKKNF